MIASQLLPKPNNLDQMAEEKSGREWSVVAWREMNEGGAEGSTGRGVRSATGLGWLRFGMFHHPDGQKVATVTAHQPEKLLKSKSTQPSR